MARHYYAELMSRGGRAGRQQVISARCGKARAASAVGPSYIWRRLAVSTAYAHQPPCAHVVRQAPPHTDPRLCNARLLCANGRMTYLAGAGSHRIMVVAG